jgi:DNA-binding response OmpR family regulator
MNSPPRILMIEDEAELAGLVQRRAGLAGWDLYHQASGATGLAAALEQSWDLLILDLNLPDMDGLLIVQELRALGRNLPVIMVSARGSVSERVSGLKCGADDYLAKPFEMVELLARVEALLRRGAAAVVAPAAVTPDPAQRLVRFGDCQLDLLRQRLVTPGASHNLNPVEARLLLALVREDGRVWSRDELLDVVWGYHKEVSTRTVDVHITWLRGKLRDSALVSIRTWRGTGYSLVVRHDHGT